MYIGVCDVIEYRKVKRDNNSTGSIEVVVYENVPCRLSFGSSSEANQTDTATEIKQTVKLFVAPEIEINSGSKIIVTQNNKCAEYSNSGEVKMYPTHQEINLKLFRGWT